MRWFILGLVLGACSRPQAASQQAPSPAFDIEDITAKTVALVADVDSTPKAYCSGVWVGESVFVTANHCLHTMNWYATSNVNDGPRLAYVIVEDEANDLALLTSVAPPPKHAIAHVATYQVKQGAKVATMGHPLGLWWSYSSGDVAAVRQVEDGSETVYIQTTAPVSGGNSGCGLFDLSGNLLGIGHAIAPQGANLGFFVNTTHLQDLLRSQSR